VDHHLGSLNAFELTAAIAAGAAFLCWLLSIVFREYSWTDRLWSVMPPIYALVYAWGRNFSDARLNLMAALVFLWGARLTFNYARKGGYAKGGEDYRWGVLRERLGTGWKWHAFNIAFVAGYQQFIVWAITLPAWAVWSRPSVPLAPLDDALAALFLAALAMELVADGQQWKFHQAKKAGQASGFNTAGLFAFSRHPNFFAEQAQWWLLALFPLAAGAPVLSFHWIGVVLLTLLFLGSTRFTESITLSKYPEYAQYQARVSAQIPWFPRAK
jgi:steroid 5-alpha reductase family enzyme